MLNLTREFNNPRPLAVYISAETVKSSRFEYWDSLKPVLLVKLSTFVNTHNSLDKSFRSERNRSRKFQSYV